jgi:hypothetical protein
VCEVCRLQAWALSLEALRAERAKRAADAARASGGVLALPPGAAHTALLQARWDATESARVRLMLADVAVLLGLLLSVLSGAVARAMHLPPHGLNLFVSFIASARPARHALPCPAPPRARGAAAAAALMRARRACRAAQASWWLPRAARGLRTRCAGSQRGRGCCC